MEFLDLRILDILDIVLVALLLYYIYKLVKGTVAINIFIGIVIFYLVWKLTQLLDMQMLSGVLGEFINVGMIVLIVVFQQEIRKFLLLIGSTNFGKQRNFFRQLNFLSAEEHETATNVHAVVKACYSLGATKTGALIVIKRSSPLEFITNTGDIMEIKVNTPIIESVFYKNSTLHDGAMVIEENTIVATRAILPVSNNRSIPLRYGLRHRAAIGVTEKTDATALVVSEETGKISYMRDGTFVNFTNREDLIDKLRTDLI